MKVILTFIFIVCGVSNSYGENVVLTVLSVSENMDQRKYRAKLGHPDTTATFSINTTIQNDSEIAYCESEPKTVTVEEGSTLRIDSSNFYHIWIQMSRCIIPSQPKDLVSLRPNDRNTDAWYLRLPNVSTNVSGLWLCELKFGSPGSSILPNDDGYTTVRCEIRVVVNRKSQGSSLINIVGVIVTLIILGQCIALLYCKARAQMRNRLESLVTRDRPFDRNDEVRYSAPPSRRNTKTNRANAETDSHIYEMVGVNALYKESSEWDIKNRPPLPLPGELPVPPPVSIDTMPRSPTSKLMASSLSLNSVSSTPAAVKPLKKELPPTPATALNKAPCRPPKPTDVDSLTRSLPRPPKPGSLPRPPKPGSLPRPPKPGTSLTRPPKPGSSMPKMLPTDPAMVELKKALEKRNFKNATSPSPSQQSTLEMKPTKPQPLPLAKPAKTPGAVSPLSPNLKMVIPKMDASLQPAAKSSKPEVALPRLTEPNTGRGTSISMKPGVPSFRRPNPESNASTAPLMPPQTKAKPRPLPPIDIEEDETPYSDDEEWTYEQLEQYNIYNV